MHRELERYCDELDLRLTEKQARDLGFDYNDEFNAQVEERVIRRQTVWISSFFIGLLVLFLGILWIVM